MQFYFDDRKCLLNCVSSLFRNSDDESHEYYKPSIEFTEKLIQKGFNNNIESLYVLLRDLIPPKEMVCKIYVLLNFDRTLFIV